MPRLRVELLENAALKGGRSHPKLNIAGKPIAQKYCEGKVKRTLKRKLKVLEIAKRETYVGFAWARTVLGRGDAPALRTGSPSEPARRRGKGVDQGAGRAGPALRPAIQGRRRSRSPRRRARGLRPKGEALPPTRPAPSGAASASAGPFRAGSRRGEGPSRNVPESGETAPCGPS